MLRDSISLFYVALIVSLAVLFLTPSLRSTLLGYGKTSAKSRNQPSWVPEWTWSILTKQVPRSWFLHFYILGTLLNGVLLILLNNNVSNTRTFPVSRKLLGILFEIHLVRRMLEERFMMRPSPKSMMKIPHYLLGLAFYIPTTVAINTAQATTHIHLGIGVFLIGNCLQLYHHWVLAHLRQHTEKTPVYAIPRGGLFRFICSPHYLCEWIIYFSFALMSNFDTPLVLALIWTIVCISISADQTFSWYFRTFSPKLLSKQVPDWRRVIPFVW